MVRAPGPLSLADIRPNSHPQERLQVPDPWIHGGDRAGCRSATSRWCGSVGFAVDECTSTRRCCCSVANSRGVKGAQPAAALLAGTRSWVRCVSVELMAPRW